MADQWYYSQDGNRIGPVSSRELRDRADEGKIQHSDTIWKEGIVDGVQAHQVKNLFPAGAAPLPGVAAPQASTPLADSPLAPAQPPATATAEPPVPAGLLAGQSLSVSAPPVLTPANGEEPGALPSNAFVPADEQPVEAPVKASAPPQPAPSQKPKARVVASKGAQIVSQDGGRVTFRKKCTTCGHEDASKSSLPIRNGMTRLGYFCPKCRKLRQIEIQAIA